MLAGCLLMLGAATIMGLHLQGNLLAARAIVLLTSLGTIGVGFAVASFVHRCEDATNPALFLLLPIGLLNGGFFPLPD